MSQPQTAALLAALAASGLLTGDQLADLTAWATTADAAQLARELRARKWLSDYQIREVARGRGAALSVGPYRITEPLGEGGMGLVYRARHAKLGREVALKILRPERLTRPRGVERFRREIRAAAQLSHPNVVLAIDADSDAGRHYLAMELVEGTDLARLIEASGPMPIAEACDAFAQAAAGLQHAHDRGLVHRDIKPSNLLLTPRGQVKVTDLGLARLAEPDELDARVTREWHVLGTPDFVAPEQAKNPLDADARADIYALGGTLFYLLTGRVPFEGASATEKVIRHVNDPPPSLLELRPDAPPALDAAIKRLLAKRPDDRPATAIEAARLVTESIAAPAEEVEAVIDDDFGFAGDSEPVVRVPRAAPARGQRRLAQGGVVALVAVAAAVGGTLAVRGPSVAPTVELGSADAHTGPAGIELVRAGGPLLIGVTEVTEGQYLAIVRKSPAVWPRKLRKSSATPVDSVTWDEANAFCDKLTALDATLSPGWAYRLPTEAEWETACRAGREGPFGGADKLVFGKGGVFDPDAPGDRMGEEDVTRTKMERGFPYPAGTSEPNPLGLRDLHGNVWEWTASPLEPRPDPPPGARRAQRGGSWREPAAICTCAARRGVAPGERRDDAGFRVALVPGP